MEIDRKTLKALAADTRLDILKSLGKRRKTPSELSKELNLATSTVVEHLNRLEEADLVRREETGHKWIYYALTKKGLALVKPKIPTHFVIVLSLCVIVVFAGFIYYYVNYTSFGTAATPDMLTAPSAEKAVEETRMPEEIPTPPTPPIEEPVATGVAGENMTNVTNMTNSTNTTMT